MELTSELRNDFSKKVRQGVVELIELNELNDLEDFDAGLYITNVFNRLLKTEFEVASMTESEQKSLRSFLWSAVYSDLEIEKYETVIKNRQK